jgi:hypothetical protein
MLAKLAPGDPVMPSASVLVNPPPPFPSRLPTLFFTPATAFDPRVDAHWPGLAKNPLTPPAALPAPKTSVRPRGGGGNKPGMFKSGWARATAVSNK